VIVSFRGTATLGDWLTDLNAFSTRADYGTVHRGFYFAFQAVKASLEKILGSDALTRRVILTGHSLGGALATIAAAEWQNKYPIAAIYTFGQPAVGKTDFHAFISGHYKDNFHRFVNDDDIVPKVPPTYKHVGRLYHFGPGNELQTTLTEALLTSDAPQTMSEAEFAALQAALRSGVTPATTESIGQEGFFPSVSDHKMDRYLSKVLSQLS
jgi:hypothetical protein